MKSQSLLLGLCLFSLSACVSDGMHGTYGTYNYNSYGYNNQSTDLLLNSLTLFSNTLANDNSRSYKPRKTKSWGKSREKTKARGSSNETTTVQQGPGYYSKQSQWNSKQKVKKKSKSSNFFVTTPW